MFGVGLLALAFAAASLLALGVSPFWKEVRDWIGRAPEDLWLLLLFAILSGLVYACALNLTGWRCRQRLSGVRVHSDTSGLTVSRGRPKGAGMVATLFAGYPAPAIVGLGVALLAGTGHSSGVLWLLVLLAAVLLVWIRNLYGALVVIAAGVGVGLVTWYAPPSALGWIATGLAWLFLWAAPRPVLELLRRHSPGSDAAQLAGLTRVHRYVWCALWLVLTVAALAAGALLMVPDLYRTLASLAQPA